MAVTLVLLFPPGKMPAAIVGKLSLVMTAETVEVAASIRTLHGTVTNMQGC